MEERFWTEEAEMNEEMEYQDRPVGNAQFLCRGNYTTVQPGSPFAETVLSIARGADMGKFKVYMDEVEITRTNAPATVPEGVFVKIVPYDAAA